MGKASGLNSKITVVALLYILTGCTSYDKIGAGGSVKVNGILAYVVGLEAEFWIGMERYKSYDATQIPIYQNETPDSSDIDYTNSSDQWLWMDQGSSSGEEQGNSIWSSGE